VDGYNVYTIPPEFGKESSTGFLIAAVTFKHSVAASGTWTHIQTTDLRGTVPSTAATSGGVSTSQFLLLDGTRPMTGDLDLAGNMIDLDADNDTSITADVDDQIDFEVGGSDVVPLTATDLNMGVHLNLDLGKRVIFDTDEDSYISADVDDLVVIAAAGSAVCSFSSLGVVVANNVSVTTQGTGNIIVGNDVDLTTTGKVIMDADDDSYFTATADDVVRVYTSHTLRMSWYNSGTLCDDTLDVNGYELILDADADTSITADSDDQIDVRIAGADEFVFTASQLDCTDARIVNSWCNSAITVIEFNDDNTQTADRYLTRSRTNDGSRERFYMPYDGEIVGVMIYYYISVDGGGGVDIDWEFDDNGAKVAALDMTYTGGSGTGYVQDQVLGVNHAMSAGDYFHVQTNHLAAGNSVRVHQYDVLVRFNI
jgi:hypothetical protein